MKKEQTKIPPKVKLWNLNKASGWMMYKKLTENNTVLKAISENNEGNPEKITCRIERELNRIKHKSFSKVKFRSNTKFNNEALKQPQQRKQPHWKQPQQQNLIQQPQQYQQQKQQQ